MGVHLPESRIIRFYKMLSHYFTFKVLVFSSRNKELEITTSNNSKHLQILEPNYVVWDFGSTTFYLCDLEEVT